MKIRIYQKPWPVAKSGKFLVVLLVCICINNTVLFAQYYPLQPELKNKMTVILEDVDLKTPQKPVFKMRYKGNELCKTSGNCIESGYKDYIPATGIAIYEGKNVSRKNKHLLKWDLKFIKFCPSTITYGDVPYNAMQRMKPGILENGNQYTICIYSHQNRPDCYIWHYNNTKQD